MATSGSVDFSVSRDDIITDALIDLGVMGAGDTTSSASFTDHSAAMAIKLNNIVKQFSGQSDFGGGIKMWSRKTGYLFLQKGEAEYTLGPTVATTGDTDKFAHSYVTTTTSAASSSGGSTITLTSVTGVATTYRIGVQLTTGYMQWTTVNGAPSGSVVTLTNTLTGDVASGARVFCYATTSQGRRPLSILTAVSRDTSNNDSPVDPMIREDYESISTKMTNGDPNQYHYAATLTDGTLYFNCQVNDPTDVLRIVYVSPIEDFDAAANTPDYDPSWYRFLCFALKFDACGQFGQESRASYFKAVRDEALKIAQNAIPETTDLYFQPG